MRQTSRWLAAALVLATAGSAPAQYSVKVVDKAEPPEGLQEPVRKLLGPQSVQFLDKDGVLLAELWFRKEVPAKATPAQVKNGLTYREVEETTLIGAVHVVKALTDYRKQNIKPGTYTLRLGFQPQDGDHMGTAPAPEFCLLVPAADDKEPKAVTAKELQEKSTKASGTSHPAVFLLFPTKGKADKPALAKQEGDHWVLSWKQDVSANGEKTTMTFSLTLVGISPAA